MFGYLIPVSKHQLSKTSYFLQDLNSIFIKLEVYTTRQLHISLCGPCDSEFFILVLRLNIHVIKLKYPTT